MNPVSILAILIFLGTVLLFWLRKWSIVQGLVIANLLVFVATILSGDLVSIRGSPVVPDLGFRPAYLLDPEPLKLYTALTSSFVHANIPHVIGNILILILIGPPYEERVGRVRFLAVYLASAFAGVLLHTLYATTLGGPGATLGLLVGASGAIFGIIGAIAAAYPRERVYMIVPILIFPRQMPAAWAALVAAAMQVFVISLSGGGLISTRGFGGVAQMAHLGGAVGGVVLGLLLKPKVTGVRAGGGTGLQIDYSTLDRLAVEPRQKDLVERLRMNEGHPELQAAWVDRIAATFRCPMCGKAYQAKGRGLLRCTNGHEERYAR